MSRTTNASKAHAAPPAPATTAAQATSASARSQDATARRMRLAADRVPHRRCSEQTGEVIEKRQRHHHCEHGHADALAKLEGAVGKRTALDEFDEIIQQMPAIQ